MSEIYLISSLPPRLCSYFCSKELKTDKMKKVLVIAIAAALTLSSCVSKQKYVELEEVQNATSDKLSNTKMELAAATAAKNAQSTSVSKSPCIL